MKKEDMMQVVVLALDQIARCSACEECKDLAFVALEYVKVYLEEEVDLGPLLEHNESRSN